MNLENEMYRVMTVFCSGGIPIDFKGAMVLHAFLYENGLTKTPKSLPSTTYMPV